LHYRANCNTVRSTVANLSIYNVTQFSWNLFIWAATTSILTAQNKVIPAAVERVNKVRQQVQEPIKSLRKTFRDLHRFGDRLFGYVSMEVVRRQNRAEIVIQSNSRLPQNVVVKMMQDAMR